MAKGIKTGGRESGTPNKMTIDLRNIVKSFIDKNIDEMQFCFEQLEPKEKLIFIEKMLQYCLPKMQSIAVTPEKENSNSQPPVFVFTDLSKK